MEASTAIGFQTVLTVSELGLSQALWPVSMVTSLMGVRGCVRKRSLLTMGVENYMACCCVVATISDAIQIIQYPGWLLVSVMVLVYFFLGSFLCLLLSIWRNKSESTTKWLTQEIVGYVRNDPGHWSGILGLVAKWVDPEVIDLELITSCYISVSIGDKWPHGNKQLTAFRVSTPHCGHFTVLISDHWSQQPINKMKNTHTPARLQNKHTPEKNKKNLTLTFLFKIFTVFCAYHWGIY